MTQAMTAARVTATDADSAPSDSTALSQDDPLPARSKRRFAVVLLPAVVLIALAALLHLQGKTAESLAVHDQALVA